ncbi:OLC1v1003552C2 [Oldenlandia corymbosa var. corymbosa]|uniref:E2 ubiquitin-conjugating enzyme n=1 Tax=Oldenlandia corymbosa var. corymbosa TaxID=529605 RepID=A0AAV1DD16_OLDCO|nr:OLC1v1003552C2 [Oldenlandia corymbosa var. corymbosa]
MQLFYIKLMARFTFSIFFPFPHFLLNDFSRSLWCLLEHMETGKGVDSSDDAGLVTVATDNDSPANELHCCEDKAAETKPAQNVSYVYRQDVVRSNINGKVGFVTEVAGDSDSDGSLTDDDDDEDDDDDDDDDDNDENEGEGDGKEAGDDEALADNSEKVDGTFDAYSRKSRHLPADQVRVFWMDDTETTEGINDVQVLDRGFLHGDYVASASDPTGQVGVVVDVNISVDLLTHGDGSSIIEDVNTKNLKRVRDFTVGDYVVLGPWLGRVDDVMDNVTVLFDDGSVCKVLKADPMNLRPVGKNILEDGHFPFYPGQRVRATSSSVFKNSRWLSGVWKANRREGIVTKVAVGSVFIYWIASAGYGPDSSTTPAEEQSPKNLKLLSCFSHANWQLGDWCLLQTPLLSIQVPVEKGLSKLELSDSPKEETDSAQTGTESSEVVNSDESIPNCESTYIDGYDSVGENVENKAPAESSSCASSLSISKESAHESWPLHRKKIRKVVIKRDKKARKKEDNFERALLIVNMRTTVDVAWQDGTIGRNMNSTSLIPIESPGDHEFVAEQYVIEKAADDLDDANEYKRVGVVQSVNAKEKTAHVKWLKKVTRPEDPREFDKEEVVSVYELEGHPDFDYCYGDVVVRLSPVSVLSETSDVLSFNNEPELPHASNEVEPDVGKKNVRESTEVSFPDNASAEFSDLSWVGNITGLKNGDIEVTWADGMVTLVGPQAIYVVDRDDDESIGGGSEISDGAASWETVEDDEMETHDNNIEDARTESVSDIIVENEDDSENSGRNGPLAIPLAALGFMTRLASGIFSRGRKHTDPDSRSESDLQPLEFSGREDLDSESCSQRSNGGDSIGSLCNKVNTAEQGDNEAAELLDVAEAICNLKPDASATKRLDDMAASFKGFDISKDPYDHHFLNATKQNNAGRKWLRKVQQDWNILQNNLPDGIYVRVYEDRMDLLRAVIVGAYGTPYQEGLFFFDFHLPPEYPDVPPSAYYHSGGWRINPNLYEEGKVCLSLLNTWTGRGNEVWDPSSSSILQVLVSLQGLVLNSKPYFNEAGYDKQMGTAEGEKNSLSYNENTFLLNCKTMMYLIRKPPKDFEELVQEHFRKRGYYILKACDAYMKGYLIGSLAKDASISKSCDADSNSNSIGFKIMLAKLVTKLYNSFSEIGANCQDFKHLQHL